MLFPFPVGEGRVHGKEGPAVLGLHCAGNKVHLSAGPADLAQADRLAADLPEQIDGNTAVDGDEIVQLADHLRVVDIAHRRAQDAFVVVQIVVELPRAVAH